jgi:hypothetical protein
MEKIQPGINIHGLQNCFRDRLPLLLPIQVPARIDTNTDDNSKETG